MPHYGHVLTGYVKVSSPVNKTMRGHRVIRRFGWDCHGLPAEKEMEKEAGIHGRTRSKSSASRGSTKAAARLSSSMVTSGSRIVTRQGRWVDFKNDNKTSDSTSWRAVLWAFKSL